MSDGTQPVALARERGFNERTLAELIATFRSLKPAIVALDGPAGSGKSTVGRQLAALVDFLFFDTGVMYRAVTCVALNRKINVHDEGQVDALAEQIQIDVLPPAATETDGRQCTVAVGGEDITNQLRTQSVDQNVSIISAYGVVRQALSANQRRISQYYGTGQAEKRGIIMAGRDIGTVVVPEAPLKIYLDASAEERARRRYAELRGQGKQVEYTAVLHGIIQRDELDSHRAISPLRPAADAIVLDTSNMTPEAVVTRILQLAQAVVPAQ
ncbi:MAG: (d)CMP kinase [Caldilineaceae bacterium]